MPEARVDVKSRPARGTSLQGRDECELLRAVLRRAVAIVALVLVLACLVALAVYVAAPVATYSSGYGGVARPSLGVSFSTPMLPEITPVVYPTRANISGGFRHSGTPPWWPSAINYIDQN